MRSAAVLASSLIGLAAGTAAAQQGSATYSLSWTEVLAGTATPVTNPNGIVEPGEAARLKLTIAYSPNIGSPVSYTPPPGTGMGMLRGVSTFVDVLNIFAGSGVWSQINLSGVTGMAGTADAGGVHGIDASYFSLTTGPNPLADFWTGTFTPATYGGGQSSALFTMQAAVGAPGAASFQIQYGQDPGGNPLLLSQAVPAQLSTARVFGLVPAPSSLALLGMGMAVVGRRRR